MKPAGVNVARRYVAAGLSTTRAVQPVSVNKVHAEPYARNTQYARKRAHVLACMVRVYEIKAARKILMKTRAKSGYNHCG